MEHHRHGKVYQDLLAADDSKYLLEDLSLNRHDIVRIKGTHVENKQDGDSSTKERVATMVPIWWIYDGNKLGLIHMSTTTTVEVMLGMVKQSRVFIPDTVQLWLEGKQLTNLHATLLGDLHMNANDELEIKGAYFPLATLNKDLDFLQNTGFFPFFFFFLVSLYLWVWGLGFGF